MKIAKFIVTGLFTDPTGECNGMRPMADRLFAGEDPDDLHFVSWDERSPDQLCRMVLSMILAKPYDRVIMFGHSFGGAFTKFFGDWLNRWHRSVATIDLAVFFDPAPNLFAFDQATMWQLAQRNDSQRWHVPTAMKSALCFYQHNQAFVPREHVDTAARPSGRFIGVCGVPFCEAAAKQDGVHLVNVDASPWNVDHCSIISEPHVQQLVTEAVTALRNTPLILPTSAASATDAAK